MINFRFEEQTNSLILEYTSMTDNQWIIDRLRDEEQVVLRNTFSFTVRDWNNSEAFESSDPDYEQAVEFKLGVLEEEYLRISPEILSTTHAVFIHKDITLKSNLFITPKNISIFSRIGKYINESIIIGGSHPKSIHGETFLQLLKLFPNEYEMKLYADARITAVLKNHFETTYDKEQPFLTYVNKKPTKQGDNIRDTFREIELLKFEQILAKIEEMLSTEQQYSESQWQDEILQIILLLYPKYISAFKEAEIYDTHYDTSRRLDFLLIDSSGNIDIVEIKRPFDNNIVSNIKYRDNHIPLRELSGTIMQIEKYIFNLNRWGKKGEQILTQRYREQLPEGFQIKITNPSGIIIMGREDKLDHMQKLDFEIIRRKYKSVVDIITYDDLIRRLRFTIKQLSNS